MSFDMKGRRGGPRRGAGRKPEIEGAPRRNRVVVLVTDAEFSKLGKLAERAGAPLGTLAYRLLARALRKTR